MADSKLMRQMRRLHALGATGQFFSDDEFDRERYTEITDIALSILADMSSLDEQALVELFEEPAGYRTPKLDVRGAVIRGNQILLVREKSDGLWALPGGYADVGFSAAENVSKEIREEANLGVTVARLYAVRHKTKHDYNPDVRDFYKLYFLCPADTTDEPTPGLETADARYFDRNELPALSRGRTIEMDIEAAFAAHADPSLAAVFD